MQYRPRRRELIAGIALVPFLIASGGAQAETKVPKMVVNKDPNCGCCGSWVDYLKAKGFTVDVIERADMDRVKADHGVPAALQSCHTAKIGGYVIEGHVPADAIQRLLADKPRAIGLAVPGMPASAPGMDVPGAADVYEVVLFGAPGQTRYARYRGHQTITD